ncbi:MAG: Nif3-like dinuclear metal center hexameric protein [Pseudomonadales bacterium]|jgi:dinuclear metal center YbgI/SA1388 family protein|uniref:Nif3-like dinuclear metal center hexameric protein n=1 Tax=Halopseudomonas TaxID=2901189 RepID=UPI000C53D6E7|nr:Nif3-like dinuclear metal center hexameric protein [Halopseudomonas aestusnigri]MAH00253.1 Nif3-like dinuclear metal center hexameric protein [Pseudomonadales bacterium]MEE2798439.1 Nif3-like dinuclear metal center hexameric protein [Pseudomonadota bacterium]HBT58587.1 Nif3-like dinuclear metal center hexameric protein [Pseudomonas sp.]MAK72980.1 Nif3-like dinuclear metal center hexameric protein [Pseudomonadales bacterium]MAP77175.1 Nif3-like dinuclear metal center hexameric protein [Pseud|tara:strand:+ start:2392 stop:3150 length:759 start_codon:yes stop_codon:yes gene_type:complete
MVDRDALIRYCNKLLDSGGFQDYCPNGLQVEGRTEIRRIVSGVTASQALVDAAVEARADLLLVHHGYFWRGESAAVVGVKQRRLKALLQNDINLVAYHLPLDVHAELGNNVQLARLMGWQISGGLEPNNPRSVGLTGELAAPCAGEELAALLAARLQREPLFVAGHDRPVKRIAWCTGAAQGYIDKAIALGVDAFITGEVSEPTVHAARENGIHFYAAGHHATERYGAKALGEHLAATFGLEHRFIDIDNPV